MSIFSLGNPGTSRIYSNSFNEHSSYNRPLQKLDFSLGSTSLLGSFLEMFNDYQLGLNNSGNLTFSLTGLSADAN